MNRAWNKPVSTGQYYLSDCLRYASISGLLLWSNLAPI
jgi:hypothetical protein